MSEVKTSLALVANLRDFQAFTVPAAGSPASAISTQSSCLAHNARRDHQSPPWHPFLLSLSPFIPVLRALTTKLFRDLLAQASTSFPSLGQWPPPHFCLWLQSVPPGSQTMQLLCPKLSRALTLAIRSGELFLSPTGLISYLCFCSTGRCVSASHNIRNLEINTNFTHSVFCRL